MDNTLDKLSRIGVKVRLGNRVVTKESLSYSLAESEPQPSRPPTVAGMACPWAVALCGLIVLVTFTLAVAQLPPMPKAMHVRVATDADPPEVRPAYWMQCPEPTCPNTNEMGPLHWRFAGGDTNWIDIQYQCQECKTEFFVRKRTH